MKFINARAYQNGDLHGLEVLYDDKEGRHEIKTEGETPKEILLDLLNMVVKLAQNQIKEEE
ncbi:hypothetical protein CEE45_01710 [Candidatus Heimdallarchaeota archaeon B3_Heim]|nr:MAG: hypothetical protein CEE45_01710 [Candidatus Heimdallarchaeota archaeon B3_Heim]